MTKDGTLVEEYQYDSVGRRTYEMNVLKGISGRTFTYSDEDHLLTAGDITYQYDADGFLATKIQEANVTQYNYSSRGELLGVYLPDGRVIEYVNDPMGRRIAKKVDGVINEKYLWQGLTRLLAVYDGSDNMLMRFDYADGRMPVAMTKTGTTYYLMYDPVGSLMVVVDASGNVVKSIDYDSFGSIFNDTNSTFTVPFGFAGGLHDRDTGIVRFGFRDYYPDVGRWTAKDPILFWGGDINLYGFVLSDPVNWIDPWGLWGASVHSGIDNPNFGTYIWSRQVGFSDAQAKIIANGNNAADNYAGWAIVAGVPGRHFNTSMGGFVDSRDIYAKFDLELATKLYEQGNPCEALKTLGRGLHSIQDKVSHGSWPFMIPHPNWVDDPFERPMTLKATELATKEYLRTFLERANK